MTPSALKHPLLFSLLALGLAAASAAPVPASTDRQADRWDLTALYASDAAFDADAKKLSSQLQLLGACKGQLAASPARLKNCLELVAEARKRVNTLTTYAAQYYDQDTGDSKGNQLNQRAALLGNDFTQATTFLQPEILALGARRIEAMLAKDQGLQLYRFQLSNMLRSAPHTLDVAGEQLVAQFGLATSSAASVYRTLANAEIPWPTVQLSDGTQVRLDQAAYTKYRGDDRRADRKLVFDAFFGKWKEYERTFGETLYGQLKTDAAYAKVRHYADSQSAALDADHLPPAVYQTLIAQTNANLPTLHRYFKLRARMLGVKDLAYYDIYAPLLKSERSFPLADGKQMMLASVAPLGPDYVKALTSAVEARWMDVYPRPRKVAGAYMNGDAYDVHPVLANKEQPSIYAPYSIFVAEIASTTNEALLLDARLKQAKDDDERLLYLGAALETLRGTFFRQAMFAEFEAAIHGKVDTGESLTGEEITAIYAGILKRYHGEAQGVMTIDPAYALEWAYVPHFYHGFYVFQYATSIAAAQDFAQRILDKEPGALAAYLKMLGAGGSAYPYDLVKAAGVDLASPKPYQALVARMNGIMDQIEAIEAKRGK